VRSFINNTQLNPAAPFRKQSAKKIHILPLLSLCFLLLFLVGCNTSTTSNGAGSPVTVQQVPHARLTYVAIGASDTFGVGADDPQTENWPTDLSSKLGSDVNLINLGIPAITAHQALNLELPIAIDAHPNLVTIWLAVNDIIDKVPLSDYSQNLDQLLTRLQAADPGVHIVVGNVPDLTILPYFSSLDQVQLAQTVRRYNTSIASIVGRHHAILVNIFQQWQVLRSHPEYISDDGLHPSTLGYTQLAELFYQALQAAQNVKNP
jgi:lysophospholipase L1-like esterase